MSGSSAKTELKGGPLLPQWREAMARYLGFPEKSLDFDLTELDKIQQQKALDRHRIQHRKMRRR